MRITRRSSEKNSLGKATRASGWRRSCTLREQKIKLDKAYTLPVLGILALLPVEIDAIVRDLGSAQTALRARKGFGSLSIDTPELLLLVASIIAGGYSENAQDGILAATLSTSLINMIIAQQAAMMVIAASAASTSAAAS